MFEQQSIVEESDAAREVEIHALNQSFQSWTVPPVAPRNAGFQLPRRVWMAMLFCYALFFGAIFVATGGSASARFAIIVSVLYTIVYFAVARIGARQAGRELDSPLDQGKLLDTWTGLMDKNAVYGQVLIVPLAVALFGIAILIITLSIGAGS